KDKLYFKSGGGITVYSNPEKEYEELIRKISIPVHRDCQN
ncbi:MAG TPA: chorismate-binding protein, partial [Spirochaetota bacterium]|nr:chorismate-binding protein [Spirochaetota bacterium]